MFSGGERICPDLEGLTKFITFLSCYLVSGFEVIVCVKREDPIEIQGRNLDFCCNWHHFGGKVLIWFVDSAVLEPGFDFPVSVVCCMLVYSWIEL